MNDNVSFELSKPLDATRVRQRQAGGGRSVSYLEGYDVINTANRIFGFEGWALAEPKIVFFAGVGQHGAYSATVSVHVGDTWRGDVGFGIVQGPSPDAHDVAIKGAVTDAMKRAFRTFGAQFGNDLYDKTNPQHTATEARPAQRTAPAAAGGTGISERQVAFARKLSADADAVSQQRFSKPLPALSKREASELIDFLQNRGLPSDEEVPF